MSGSSLTTFQSKILKMSSAQSENRCQSSGGVPSIAQMIGMGYCLAMSATTSQRPALAWLSTSSAMMSAHVVRSRPAALGVDAFDTSRRCR